MTNYIARLFALIIAAFLFASPVLATCGGGGGGGGGGMSGSNTGGGSAPTVYYVPWKVFRPSDVVSPQGMTLYWFPASAEEVGKSSLKESRALSLYAGQCIDMKIADDQMPFTKQLVGESVRPVVVLANPDGTAVGRVENDKGKFKIGDVEKLVSTEVKRRESALDASAKDAKAKAASGDKPGAIQLYQSIAAEKCMFPKKAKDASKELEKLGAGVADNSPSPNFDPAVSAKIVALMQQGLRAENAAAYKTAERRYTEASRLDPADPTPLRYLGELLRHHLGEWDRAREAFDRLLALQNVDPLSRAVALHGLGKMTIHDGDFLKGLHLMEESAEVYPLALTYRNLAVYWNSEHEFAKADAYTQKALAMDPKDPYMLVFAAVFMAMSGHKEEALRIADANKDLLPASYNLAAIYAQNGRKTEALAYLKRHFFTFERYQSVREKEMMEARVDAVFDSLRADSAFLALTSGADGKLPMPMSPREAGEMRK
jgi:tetratricopeptide (TPR) repeat protein